MSHLHNETLTRLIAGSFPQSDVQQLRRHVDGCRACARRLEEWRDNFVEVDRHYPELSLESGALATVTSEGLVLLPRGETPRRLQWDLTTGLWIGAVVMALVVGYGTYRARATREVVDMATLMPPPVTEPESRPATTMPPTPPPGLRDSLRPAGSETAAGRIPASTLPISPQFRAAGMSEAARRLGGRVRTIRGFEIDHIEIGPASALPGAQSGLPVIRVVYQDELGGRFILDQQRIPADSSGFRPIEDQSLESGEVAYQGAANGASLATWLDNDGYRLSLAAVLPVESLKQLVRRVK